jgi:16S rRNA (adenine1518-N6/adenine1519-N6)-dimethyltransferase
MLQKEVIERLAAGPRTKEYGVLTLRVQSEWEVRPLRTVPPEAFHPRPQIDSSVALLLPRGKELPAMLHHALRSVSTSTTARSPAM